MTWDPRSQPLYKYFSYNGLEKTFEKQSLKLSRPSDFNDPLDLFLQEALGMDEAVFLEGLTVAFCEFVSGEIAYDSLRDSPNKYKVIMMNQAIKDDPEIIEKIQEEITNTPIEELYNVEEMRQLTSNIINLLTGLFRNDGVFCSSMDNNNLLMWAHYADQHRGAVVEFTPCAEKDSALRVSREVNYTNVRPSLYQDPIDMITHGLTMTPEESAEQILERLVYTKSTEWAYERERRLHIPRFIPDSEEYATLPFYNEELTSLCVGCRMKYEHRVRAISLAKSINPSVTVYEARIVPREFRLDYLEITDL